MTSPIPSLRQLIRDVFTQTGAVEYQELAEAVLGELDPGQYADALRVALPAYCRAVIGGQRRAAVPPLDGSPPPELPVRQPVSRKVAAIREWHRSRLDQAQYETAAGQKLLGDLTYEDLRFVAEKIRVKARQHFARASSLDRLAEALSKHGVATVRDLPDAALRGLVEEAAA